MKPAKKHEIEHDNQLLRQALEEIYDRVADALQLEEEDLDDLEPD